MAGMQETLDRAAAQLKDMTLSQRIAILLGVTLIAGSLAWMVQWAATPEYEPLLSEPLTTEQISSISTALQQNNQPYKVIGTQIFVPPGANKTTLYAQLTQAGLMPKDTRLSFESLVKSDNPFTSATENTRRWTLALQNQLAQVLGGFAGVDSASVFLNMNTAQRGFSREAPVRTASINLRMDGDLPVPRSLAMNAAKLVSGAVAGLAMKDVRVTDAAGGDVTGFDSTDGGMDELTRQRRTVEKDYRNRILDQLSYIDGVRVSVQVLLDRTARQVNAADVTEGTRSRKRTYEEDSNQLRDGGQPGVQPNTGGAVAGAMQRQSSSRRSEGDEEFMPSVTKRNDVTPAGGVSKVYAAISVPDMFLQGIFARQNPDATDPASDTELQRIFERLELRLSAQCAMLVTPATTDQLDLQWHYTAPVVAPVEASAVDQSVDLASRFAPVGLLGGLALFSLFFMMRMAKASNNNAEAFGIELGLPAEAIEAARRADSDLTREETPLADTIGPEGIDPTEIPIGTPADNVLEAQEIDEEMAQINNMLTQVAERIDEDEEVIAGMLEKWITA